MTAQVQRGVKAACLASGMDRIPVKPVQVSDLFAAIEACPAG